MSIRSNLKSSKKKSFSSFKYEEAFRFINLTALNPWQIEFKPIQPSAFFNERLNRLQCFDLQNLEESKKLLIDAICEEAMQDFQMLKIWKGAALETDRTHGNVDYLIAERKAYLDTPFLCIIEAKKDDFEQGVAQCLVEMQACQWCDRQQGRELDILGIVTNGDGWRFYQMTRHGEVYETLLYGIGNLPDVLGLLNWMFEQCQQTLLQTQISTPTSKT
jgi:hypothetical protein